MSQELQSNDMDESQKTKHICDLIYSPLDSAKREIRLVKLLTNPDPKSPVICELVTVSLRSKPSYNALSYVWGDRKDTTSIILNNEVFAVTRNLKAALRSLREPDVEVLIWIDALCINQGDDTERMHQVEQMHDIYKNTKRTLAWFGDLREPSIDQKPDYYLNWSGDESDWSRIRPLMAEADDAALQTRYRGSAFSETAGLRLVLCLLSLLADPDRHLSDLELRKLMLNIDAFSSWWKLLLRQMETAWVSLRHEAKTVSTNVS